MTPQITGVNESSGESSKVTSLVMNDLPRNKWPHQETDNSNANWNLILTLILPLILPLISASTVTLILNLILTLGHLVLRGGN